jgi:hypothetical protein
VGDGAAQDYWSLEIGIVTLGATGCIFVVHAGENRMDGKTEDGVLEFICEGRTKYP